MKKRFLSFLLVVCLAVTLCACGEPTSTIVTLEETPTTDVEANNSSPSQISVFSTRNDEEYLEFLTGLSSEYEIIDISTGMYTYAYGESYIVTYKLNTEDNVKTVSYKYYLYKTRTQSEYLSFYSTFDFDTYEIIDISTHMYTYVYGESYMITYRKPN